MNARRDSDRHGRVMTDTRVHTRKRCDESPVFARGQCGNAADLIEARRGDGEACASRLGMPRPRIRRIRIKHHGNAIQQFRQPTLQRLFREDMPRDEHCFNRIDRYASAYHVGPRGQGQQAPLNPVSRDHRISIRCQQHSVWAGNLGTDFHCQPSCTANVGGG